METKKRRPCRNCHRKKYTDKMRFIMKTTSLFGNNLPMEVWECKNKSTCNKPRTRNQGQFSAKLSLVPGTKKKQNIESEEIASRHPGEKPIIYNLPDGSKITIGKHMVDFLEQLQELPASTKIILMKLSPIEMDRCIKQEKENTNNKLMYLLKKSWYDRETGEKAVIYNDTIKGFKFTQAELLKKCRSKKPFELEEMQKLIEYFRGDQTEVYLKEERE